MKEVSGPGIVERRDAGVRWDTMLQLPAAPRGWRTAGQLSTTCARAATADRHAIATEGTLRSCAAHHPRQSLLHRA